MKRKFLIVLMFLMALSYVVGCGMEANKAGVSADVILSAENEATVRPTASPTPTKTPVATTTPAHSVCTWNEGVITTAHAITTESTPSTCTEAGKAKEVCSVCGYVESEVATGFVLGHDYEKVYVMCDGPTCTNGAYYNLVCIRCDCYGGDGTDPALDHVSDDGVITHEGNCTDPTVVKYTCVDCGSHLGYDNYLTDEHDWITGYTDPYWSVKEQKFVQDEVTYCSRCNIERGN